MSYRLYLGPCGTCPDCDELTEVQLASVLGEPKQRDWEVPRDLLRLIYQGLVRSHTYARTRTRSDADKPTKTKTKVFTCVKCRHKAQKLHWAEILDGGVVGPFCKKCLRLALDTLSDERGLKDDVPIYIVPGRKSSLTIARSALLLRPPDPEVVSLPSDDEVVLF
jgi:hypothetical protein